MNWWIIYKIFRIKCNSDSIPFDNTLKKKKKSWNLLFRKSIKILSRTFSTFVLLQHFKSGNYLLSVIAQSTKKWTGLWLRWVKYIGGYIGHIYKMYNNHVIRYAINVIPWNRVVYSFGENWCHTKFKNMLINLKTNNSHRLLVQICSGIENVKCDLIPLYL